MSNTDEQTDGPKLSLCMIVRDEAQMLPDFLRHAEGLWDEFIAVDTGSKDDTVALLEAAGAQVFYRAWDDDFAAARNESLSHATGRFILVLDADEMVSDAAKAEITRTVQDDKVGAATLLMRNELPHGHHRDAPLLRLFRNAPEVRYQFPIHEEVATSLRPYLQTRGLSVVHLEGLVMHRGYVRERAAGRGKKERDLRILERALGENPGDLYVHFKRMELARYWDDTSLLQHAASDAASALQEAGDAGLAGKPFGGELITLLAQAVGDADAALPLLDRYADVVLPSADLYYYRGTLHEVADRPDKALADFERCLTVDDAGYSQMSNVRPLMGLCRVHMAAQQPVEAASYVERALEHNPRDPEALLAAMTLLREGGAAQLRKFAEEYLVEHGPHGEMYVAWGEVALSQGDLADAIEAFGEAAGKDLSGRPALSLANALLQAGDQQRAHDVLAPLVSSMPEAGLGLLACELCLDRDSDLELDMGQAEADKLLGEWMMAALRGADDKILANVIKRVPTVQHAFPWLPEALGLAA